MDGRERERKWEKRRRRYCARLDKIERGERERKREREGEREIKR